MGPDVNFLLGVDKMIPQYFNGLPLWKCRCGLVQLFVWMCVWDVAPEGLYVSWKTTWSTSKTSSSSAEDRGTKSQFPHLLQVRAMYFVCFCLSVIAGNDNHGDFLGGTFNQSLHPHPLFSGFWLPFVLWYIQNFMAKEKSQTKQRVSLQWKIMLMSMPTTVNYVHTPWLLCRRKEEGWWTLFPDVGLAEETRGDLAGWGEGLPNAWTQIWGGKRWRGEA